MQSCPGSTVTTDPDVDRQSVYVSAADGVKLAVDIFLPKGLAPGTKFPTFFAATRYQRGQKNKPIAPRDKPWIARGFAVVNADVRGTGASFGQWSIPYSPQEVKDVGYLANWIAIQPWSNGKVVMTGVSYGATTALDGPCLRHARHQSNSPCLRRFECLHRSGVARRRGERSADREMGVAGARDGSEPAASIITGRAVEGVRRSSGPDGEAQLAAAVEEHKSNPFAFDQAAYGVTFKDLPLPQFGGMPIDASGVFNVQDAIERSHVPILGSGSWLDSGIAQGLVNRFMTWTNPQLTIIGPWTHGARMDVNVFTPNKDVEPAVIEQERMIYCFLSNYVGPDPAGFAGHTLIYYTMGEDQWKETSTWPIPGTKQERLYLDAGHALSSTAPAAAGHNVYTVDFEAAAGPADPMGDTSGRPAHRLRRSDRGRS